MTLPRPERIAAVARALGSELCRSLAQHADAIAGSLQRDLDLVAWDREQIIGLLQARQWGLREERFRGYGGPPLRILERRLQPLECLEPAWRALRQGRRVRLEHERGAARGLLQLVRGIGRGFGYGVLTVPVDPVEVTSGPPADGFEDGGVPVARARVAMLEEDADPELSAYVLARSSLRRGGMDPRGIRRAFLVGRHRQLERHLQRLWVGARFGPASDPSVFGGPVDDATRDAYLDALHQWSDHDDVECLCPGGILERAADTRAYLAPALFRTSVPPPDLPLAGPLLVLAEGVGDVCSHVFQAAGREGLGRLQLSGGTRRPPPADDEGATPIRRIEGALLVDRVPPGLPEPRPV